MLTFIRLFGVFFGDLVRDDNEYWLLYTLLHEIVLICNSKCVPLYVTSVLEVLVKEHRALYMKLTSKQLKPKHHFLTHYNRRLFSLLGPLGSLSTVRNEAKYKLVKNVANVCCSRRNLALTVAVKHQLALCYRFKCAQSVRPPFVVGPGTVVNLQRHDQFAVFSATLPGPMPDNLSQFSPRWLEYLSTTYKVGLFLVTGTDDSKCPEFSRIELMLTFDNEPLFICSPNHTLRFDGHVKAYVIKQMHYEPNWFSTKHRHLIDPFPLSAYRTANGNTVISPRHILIL